MVERTYAPEISLASGRSLVYPVDANPEDFFPECIKFTAKQRIGMNIDKVLNETAASYKDLVKKGGEKGLDALRIHKNIENASKSTLPYWVNLVKELKKEFKEVTKQDYDKIDLVKVGTDAFKDFAKPLMAEHKKLRAGNAGLTPTQQNRKTLGSIYLNMPNAIQYAEAANWGGQALGVGGDQMNRMASGQDTDGFAARLGGAVAGNVGNLIGAGIGGIIGGISNLVGIGGGPLTGIAAGAFAGENLQRGLESGLSISQNPYMEMMFQGIGFRNFRFDFVLRPRHEKELEEVGSILKAFREFSRPSWNKSFGEQAFMNYPMEFDIQFLTLEESENSFTNNFDTNMHLPKLKPCVLTSVETNYTPQSIWAAHRAGAPVAVTLGLAFQETELVMAEDIQKSDWPNNQENNPNSSEPMGVMPVDHGGNIAG